jgi:hypothetical protein
MIAGSIFFFQELDKRSDGDAIKDALKEHITGCETVPQVFIHGKFIGTFSASLIDDIPYFLCHSRIVFSNDVLNLLLQVVATIPKPNSNLASCKS